MDPHFDVDRKASGILSFGDKTSTFTCSTQMQNYQRVTVFGTDGLIEIEIPFNAPSDQSTRIYLTKGGEKDTIEIPAAAQYTLQADAFGEAIINNTAVPTPLEDAVANMRVIDAMFKSGKKHSAISM
jgi:predicted dehydrogenase